MTEEEAHWTRFFDEGEDVTLFAIGSPLLMVFGAGHLYMSFRAAQGARVGGSHVQSRSSRSDITLLAVF